MSRSIHALLGRAGRPRRPRPAPATEPAEVLDGWVGRYFERYCDDVVSPMLGLRIGRRAPLAFASASPRSVTIENPAIMEWTG